MVNLLAFKPTAGKPREGRTGREASMAYAATVGHVQGQMGSRLWWSGDLGKPRIGLDPPPFESVGLLAGTTEERAEAPGGDWVAGCRIIVPVGTLVHEPADQQRDTGAVRAGAAISPDARPNDLIVGVAAVVVAVGIALGLLLHGPA